MRSYFAFAVTLELFLGLPFSRSRMIFLVTRVQTSIRHRRIVVEKNIRTVGWRRGAVYCRTCIGTQFHHLAPHWFIVFHIEHSLIFTFSNYRYDGTKMHFHPPSDTTTMVLKRILNEGPGTHRLFGPALKKLSAHILIAATLTIPSFHSKLTPHASTLRSHLRAPLMAIINCT